jgi:hypothetical protein
MAVPTPNNRKSQEVVALLYPYWTATKLPAPKAIMITNEVRYRTKRCEYLGSDEERMMFWPRDLPKIHDKPYPENCQCAGRHEAFQKIDSLPPKQGESQPNGIVCRQRESRDDGHPYDDVAKNDTNFIDGNPRSPESQKLSMEFTLSQTESKDNGPLTVGQTSKTSVLIVIFSTAPPAICSKMWR